MDPQKILYVLLNFVIVLDIRGTFGQRVTTEGNLRTLLWTTNSYDSLVRPDDKVNVTISFYPMSLIDLSIAEGTMTIVGFFSLTWTDSRLDWSSNAAYSSINTMFTSGKYTWYPPFVLFNSLSELDILMDPDSQNPIRVVNNGGCEYLMIRIMHTSCNTYATYYPFDSQTCNIVLALWGYTETEIDIQIGTPPVSTSFYVENGEWEYTGDQENLVSISRGMATVPTVSYDLTFRRRPLYQVLNVFLPVLLLGFLVALAFVLPPDSGERMGYSLTTLLAYAVYLTIAADSLPSVSLNISYLSIYLNFTLVMGTVVVVLSKIVLSCHHTPEDEPVPDWLVRMHNGIIGKLAGVQKMTWCWQGSSKKTNVVKVGETPTKTPDAERPSTKNFSENDTSENETEVKWPNITKFLDKIFFRLFMIITIIQQVVFGIIFIYGYICACNSS